MREPLEVINESGIKSKAIRPSHKAPVVLVFGPCARGEAMPIPLLEELNAEKKGSLLFISINTAKKNWSLNWDLLDRYNINERPALVLFNKGKVIGKKERFTSREDIEQWVQESLNPSPLAPLRSLAKPTFWAQVAQRVFG